jgi:hypothetical protein
VPGFGYSLQAVAADSHSELLGVWKRVSSEAKFQDTGEHRLTFGKNPNGYLILTVDGMTRQEPQRATA